MVNANNITKLVDELKSLLDGYRSFGQIAVDAIDALDRLRCFVVDGKFSEAGKIADNLASQANFYRDFVPDIAEKTDNIQKALHSVT